MKYFKRVSINIFNFKTTFLSFDFFLGKHTYLKPMFQESRKVKKKFSVMAEDMKNFEFCHFSVSS